jgi:hypothetical protein
VQVVDILGISIILYKETQFVSQLAATYSHLPEGVVLFFVHPSEAYMTVFLSFHYVGLQCVVFAVGVAPGEIQHAVVLNNAVGQPSLQSVVSAQQLPQKIRLAG